jgi:hypothetical protein
MMSLPPGCDEGVSARKVGVAFFAANYVWAHATYLITAISQQTFCLT